MFVYTDEQTTLELCGTLFESLTVVSVVIVVATKKFTSVVFSNDGAPLEYKLKSVKISAN